MVSLVIEFKAFKVDGAALWHKSDDMFVCMTVRKSSLFEFGHLRSLQRFVVNLSRTYVLSFMY
jgi:hypothetical protein